MLVYTPVQCAVVLLVDLQHPQPLLELLATLPGQELSQGCLGKAELELRLDRARE